MSARQEWHAVLDDVLEGTHEDLEAIMSSARYFFEEPSYACNAKACSEPRTIYAYQAILLMYYG